MCSWHCFTEKLKRFSAPMLTTLKSPEDNSSVQRWWCSNGYQSMSRFHNDSVSCSHRCRWIRLRRIRSRTCIGNCRHCCRRSRACRNLRCSRCIRWYLQPCNKKLRRARLVLGLVTTFGGSTIPVFTWATQAHSAWPSSVGGYNEYQRSFRLSVGKKTLHPKLPYGAL